MVKTTAPDGYASPKDVDYEVLDTADPQYVKIYLGPIEVGIKNVDVETGKPVIGANVEIWAVDSLGNATGSAPAGSWTTDNNEFKYTYVDEGTYKLIVTSPAPGYATPKDMLFEVVETEAVQHFTNEHSPLVLDVSKYDGVAGSGLKGAELSLYAVAGNGATGKLYETWITDGNAHRIKYIPAGAYRLIETKAPTGYQVAGPVEVNVKDTDAVQTVGMKDPRMPKLAIEKQVDKDKVERGDTLSYRIIVTQTVEGAEATGVVVKDALPGSLAIVEGSVKINGIPAKDFSLEKGTITATIGKLAYGQRASLVFDAKVAAGTIKDEVKNIAQATCNENNDVMKSAATTKLIGSPDFQAQLDDVSLQVDDGLFAWERYDKTGIDDTLVIAYGLFLVIAGGVGVGLCIKKRRAQKRERERL
jgi:fimbrial isopeptide formation D2 family protein